MITLATVFVASFIMWAIGVGMGIWLHEHQESETTESAFFRGFDEGYEAALIRMEEHD